MPSLRNLAFYVLLALFIGALSAGITLLITDDGSNSPGIEILLPTVTASPVLKVYVSGGVQIPGVYTLKRGDRVEDAIQAAGGAVEGAQLSCVNLAVRVTDEAHFHVPDAGEPCESPTAVAVAQESGGKLDLNTATAQELETLPGIGEVKARAIADYWESNGGFGSPEDITLVTGIGFATLDGIPRPDIREQTRSVKLTE